jgi:hypothetical protein
MLLVFFMWKYVKNDFLNKKTLIWFSNNTLVDEI